KPVIPSGETFRTVFGTFTATSESEGERQAKCNLIRDLFNNLLVPVTVPPAVLAWNDGAIGKLARAIYDEYRFGDLPILADALEEAGCIDRALLAHCRQAGLHAKGCWAVDLCSGRE